MLLGRLSSTSALTSLGRNLIHHSILTYALRLTYLLKWFVHTWHELNLSFPFASALKHKSDSITIGRDLKKQSILTNSIRQTYLCKWFAHTWQEHNASFNSWEDILDGTWLELNVLLILLWPTLSNRHTCTGGRNLINHSILANDLRQSYLYNWLDHTWQEPNVSLQSDQCS